MTTPYQALAVYVRALIVVALWTTLAGIAVSRCYILYDSYSQFTLQRLEEAWLRERCKEPDFYTNMRQHTDLCAQVERRARQWALLHSMNVMFTTTRLCGPRTCVDYINEMVVRGMAWPIAFVLCMFVVTMPSIITSIASRSMWRAFDSRARRRPVRVVDPFPRGFYGGLCRVSDGGYLEGDGGCSGWAGGGWHPGFQGRLPTAVSRPLMIEGSCEGVGSCEVLEVMEDSDQEDGDHHPPRGGGFEMASLAGASSAMAMMRRRRGGAGAGGKV